MDDEAKEILSEERLLEKQELSEKLNDVLDDKVITRKEEGVSTQKDEDYVYVYRGEALNEDELFQLSARDDIRRVLIAGPQSSGKTTLIIAMYYLFLEGCSRTFHFGGSLTLNGFKRRSQKINLASGEAKPTVDRTLRAEQDRNLHLILVDADGKRSNLVFADISGELFAPTYVEEIGALYGNCENVIMTIDGEKLQNPSERRHEIITSIQLLKNMLTSKVLTKRSKLQIIFTKKDLIGAGEDSDNTFEFLGKRQSSIQEQYAEYVSTLDFHTISALKIEQEDTQQELEKIILRCLDGGKDETIFPLEEPKLQRYFDKFKMRGRVV